MVKGEDHAAPGHAVVMKNRRNKRCARVGSLARLLHNANRRAGPQAIFRYVEPRATRPRSIPLPVGRRGRKASPVARGNERAPPATHRRARTFLFPSPALGQGRYGSLARRSVAVCWAAVFVLPDVQCPHPRPCYGHSPLKMRPTISPSASTSKSSSLQSPERRESRAPFRVR
jgi:hypothetical protein